MPRPIPFFPLVPPAANNHIVVCTVCLALLLAHPGIIGARPAAPPTAPATCQEGGLQPEPVPIQRLLPDDGDPASLRRLLQTMLAFLPTGGAPEPPPCWRPMLSRQGVTAAAATLTRILAEPLDFAALRRRLAAEFCLYRLPVPLLITGYYEPELSGSLRRSKRFRYPLYRRPADLVTGRNGRVWRRQGRLLRPYWTRRQIEEEQVLAGQELVWVDDPLAAFFLHIQGSGRIRLANGEVRRVAYAGNNGRPYTSIGRILVEEGVFSPEEITLPRLRRYLERHPQRLTDLLARNERYVFFRWRQESDQTAGPVGSLGVPLMAGRSLAADPACYPPGALAYLSTYLPRFTDQGLRWLPSHRFVVLLDQGAAIRGPGRLDLFFGHGPYAEKAAGTMRTAGELYVLVPRAKPAGNPK